MKGGVSAGLRVEHKALCHKLIRGLYRRVRGIALSQESRRELGGVGLGTAPHLTYGEVVSTSFEQILIEAVSLVQTGTPVGERVFVDLGSGTGKANVTAALFGPSLGIGRSIGIELLSHLHESAVGVKDALSRCVAEAAVAPASSASASPACEVNNAANQLGARIAELLSSIAEMSDSDLSNAIHSGKHPQLKTHRNFIKRFKSFRSCLQSLAAAGLLILREADGSLYVSLPTSVASLEGVDAGAQVLGEGEGEGEGEAEQGPDPVRGLLSRCTSECLALLSRAPSALEFHCGSFLLSSNEEGFVSLAQGPESEPRAWWELADVVFAASLLFSADMMLQLSAQVARMRPGSVFVSLKSLPEGSAGLGRCRLVGESFHQMSWQKAAVLVYAVQ